LDFNLDGIDDLVAACPTSGFDNWQERVARSPTFIYHGSIQVFFGRNVTDQSQVFSDTADFIIEQSARSYDFFAMTLSKGDINGDGHDDIICGSYLANQNSGYIKGYVSATNNRAGSKVDSDQAANLSISGTDQFAQFGYSLLVIKAVNGMRGNDLLVVGAPSYWLTAAGPAVGRVFGFPIGSEEKLLKLNNISSHQGNSFIINGNIENGLFGASLAYGFPLSNDPTQGVLAVSSPSVSPATLAGLAGQVQMILVKNIPSGLTSVSQLSLSATLQGTLYGGRLGDDMLMVDLNGDFIDDMIVGQAAANQIFNSKGNFVGRMNSKLNYLLYVFALLIFIMLFLCFDLILFD
jgi:hypothetical protein